MRLCTISSYSVSSAIYLETAQATSHIPALILEVTLESADQLPALRTLTRFSVEEALQSDDVGVCSLQVLGARFGVKFDASLPNRTQLAAIRGSLKNSALRLDRVKVYPSDSYVDGYEVVGFETHLMCTIGRGAKITLSAVVKDKESSTLHTLTMPQRVADAVQRNEYVNIGPVIVVAMKECGLAPETAETIQLSVGAREKLNYVAQYMQ